MSTKRRSLSAAPVVGVVVYVLVGCNTLEGLGKGVVSTAKGLGQGVVDVAEGIGADFSAVSEAGEDRPQEEKTPQQAVDPDTPPSADDANPKS